MRSKKAILSIDDNTNGFFENINNSDVFPIINQTIYNIIEHLYLKEDCSTFFCGTDKKSDLIVIDIILDAKEKYSDIKLVSIIESDTDEVKFTTAEESSILIPKPYSTNDYILENCYKVITITSETNFPDKSTLIKSFKGSNMNIFIYESII